MIGGATRGAGGVALGRHLANAAKNEEVRQLDGRGLVAEDIQAQIAELTDLGSHARTRTPLYHVHADPPAGRPWSDAERSRYWERFEQEFGLQDRPFAAVMHRKDGRDHEHRVYLRVQPNGTAIRLDHDHARREKLNRLFEAERGDALTPGAHNRAVIHALEREGRHDVAQAMRDAGLDAGPRPRAPTTPQQRAQHERTGIDPKAVGAAALAAWKASDGGRAFAAALEERGLRLAQGTKAPVIIDAEGGAHPLARILGRESKAADGQRIAAADVADRLAGLDLLRHEPGAGRRAEPINEAAPMAPTAPAGESLVAQEAAPGAAALTRAEPVEGAAPMVQAEAPVPPVEEAPSTKVAPPVAQIGQAPAAAPAGAPKGAGGGAAPSGGGAEAPDADFIAPLDPNKPGDVERFLAAFGRLMQKRAAKAAASETKGSTHGGQQQQQDGEWLREWLEHLGRVAGQAQRDGRRLEARDALAQARADRAARTPLEHRPDQGSARRDGGPRTGGSGDPGRARPQGPVARPVGDAAGRGGRGPAQGTAGAPRPARGQGDVAGRPVAGPGADDGRRDRADRAASGRARLAARRTHRTLASAVASRSAQFTHLKAALASPPTAATLARGALQADRRRARAVLNTEPHRDPRSRTADGARSELRDQVVERQREAEARADQAERRAAEARRGLRLRDRILPTSAAREARALADHADRLRLDSDLGREATGDDLRAADERAPHVAQARRREHEAWERRPDVVDAQRREEADRLIADRIRRGDRELLHRVAGGDLDGAQRQVLDERRLREEAIRRQRDEQLRREHEQRMQGYEPSRGPAPGGRSPAPSPGPRR